MIKGLESITIFSKNATKLADFYRDKVGLKVSLEAEMGEKSDNLYGFTWKGRSDLYIVDHSEVKGKNKFPERFNFNFEVDNIKSEVKRLDKTGVKKIKDTYHLQGYGWIATYKDLDGNFFQLVQIKPN